MGVTDVEWSLPDVMGRSLVSHEQYRPKEIKHLEIRSAASILTLRPSHITINKLFNEGLYLMNAKDQHGGRPISEDYHYPHIKQQRRTRLLTQTYEYEAPFKYDNIHIRRHFMRGREAHGVELVEVNYRVDEHRDGADFAGDAITITDSEPMVRVVVIGSACTPPGWVQVECEPAEGFTTPDEFDGALATRFRINDLWGMHLRVDALMTKTPGVKPMLDRVSDEAADAYAKQPDSMAELYPSTRAAPYYGKSHHRENPLAGMSCAIFEIPASKRVIIQAGSQIPAWQSDNFPGDHHYSIRLIRTDVLTRREEA